MMGNENGTKLEMKHHFTMKKHHFTMKNSLPRAVVDAPYLSVFKRYLDNALINALTFLT